MSGKILAYVLIFALLIPAFASGNYAYRSGGSLRIIFDNENASLRVYINGSQYFNLSFKKIYLAKNPYMEPDEDEGLSEWGDEVFFGVGEVGKMNMSSQKGWSEKYGNYTKVKMWKDVPVKSRTDAPFFTPKSVKVNLTVEFFMAEKNYTKDGVNVGANTIRYSTKITTEPGYFVFLDMGFGSMNLETGRHGEIYEMQNQSEGFDNCWKKMEMSSEFVKHRFGDGHFGALRFKIDGANVTYSWEYESFIGTMYSYQGENFNLLYIFQNDNGTIVQDPYITLPVSIMGNPSTVVEGVEEAVNYLMDHAISLGIGIVAAVLIVLSGPLSRRFR